MNSPQCGFGCLVHKSAYCLITALATRRVLILSDLPWYYSNITVKRFFLPVSSSCTSYEGPTKKVSQVFQNDSTQNVELRHNYDLSQPYDPPALPSVLAERILRYNFNYS
eukprot:GFUD01103324.1.p1 GENE.GFUD01103324.1~~GFUD01103324.1.p1  ORF type:complete len:110 (-),score=13.79 GFUD01103324.1:56-385(-)